MLDPVLREFVEATNEEQARHQLDCLVRDRVRPLLGRIAARKLGPSSAKAFQPEDLEDVVGDATLLLLKRLQEMRVHPGIPDIESLDDYAAAVGYTVCAHRLRLKHPERSRLKACLRRVLAVDHAFALWRTADGRWCCGFSHARGTAPTPLAMEELADVDDGVEQDDTRRLLGRLFERVGGAVEFERVVTAIAGIRQIDRPPQRSGTLVDDLPATGAAPDVALDDRRSVERLWKEIQQLPIRQRAALLLNLRDSQGAGLLWILPVIGVASMRAIAEALGMPHEELSELWSRLPIDDATLAGRLGCTRQQVINLRMSARKRLSNRLRRRST
jgi:hypothetical protein